MGADDAGHHLLIRESDIVENAAAQEGVRQFLLRVGCDDHDGALLCLDGLSGLRNVEFHLIKLPEQVVRELQVRLVDLVDQKHSLLLLREGNAQLSEFDIAGNIVHAVLSELAVVKTLDSVIDVQAVLGLRRRLYVPDDQFHSQGIGDGFRQHGLAGAGFSLHQKRLLKCRRNVDAPDQFLRRNIILASAKLLHDHSPFRLIVQPSCPLSLPESIRGIHPRHFSVTRFFAPHGSFRLAESQRKSAPPTIKGRMQGFAPRTLPLIFYR